MQCVLYTRHNTENKNLEEEDLSSTHYNTLQFISLHIPACQEVRLEHGVGHDEPRGLRTLLMGSTLAYWKTFLELRTLTIEPLLLYEG